MTIEITGYGRGQNGKCVTIGNLNLWFSYETCIAFQLGNMSPVVRENEWSTTTGSHMVCIDGGDKSAKALRLSSDAFNKALQAAVAEIVATSEPLRPCFPQR